MRVSQKASPFGSKNGEKGCSASAKKRQCGCGLSGSHRRRSDKPALAGVTKSDIRRLARKAGMFKTAQQPAIVSSLFSENTWYSMWSTVFVM